MSNVEAMQRFLALGSYNPINGCYEMRIVKSRYPIFLYNGKNVRANRLSYMWANNLQNLPSNIQVCHKCDNTKCVNPDHLFLGTNQDNTIDMIKKNRGPRQIMSFETAVKAKELLVTGLRWEEVSRQLNIQGFAIRDLACGKSWNHLPAHNKGEK